MDKIEKICQEIKKRHGYKNEELDDHEIIDYAHSKFYYDKDFDGYGHGKFRPVLTREDLISFVRHFVKWGAEHTPLPEDTVLFNKGVAEGKRLMMEEAVEKTVGQLERQWGGNIHFMHGFEVDEMDFPFLNSQECGYGDKVRIIVCKKED